MEVRLSQLLGSGLNGSEAFLGHPPGYNLGGN